MANIKSFPNNQDEYIGAEYVMKWLHGRTSGVFAADNNAAVAAVQNEMAVTVSDGLGWMANAGKDGVVWWIDNEAINGEKLKLPIAAADTALNRIDRIIVEWKTTNYADYPEVKVLKGSLAGTAVAPALTNNSSLRQISLARVNIAAGTTAITASMITDERLDPSVCGLVTESISIDTSMVNKQFSELLELIQSNLEQIMNGQIADQSITKEKLANGAVTVEKLANGAVTVQKLSQEAKNFISAYNLLDNSDFTNPVNQRGDTTYTGAVYGIDRWIGGGGKSAVLVEPNGITLVAGTGETGLFNQRLDYAISKSIYGKVCTVAFCEIDGTITIASGVFVADDVSSTTKLFEAPSTNGDYKIEVHKYKNTQNFNVRVALNAGLSKTFIWAALYEGEYTADNLPVYQPKGYGAELDECMRYYLHNIGQTIPGFFDNGTNRFIGIIPIPKRMRINPSATLVRGDNIVCAVGSTPALANVKGITEVSMFDSYVSVVFSTGSCPASFCAGTTYSTLLNLSADL